MHETVANVTEIEWKKKQVVCKTKLSCKKVKYIRTKILQEGNSSSSAKE